MRTQGQSGLQASGFSGWLITSFRGRQAAGPPPSAWAWAMVCRLASVLACLLAAALGLPWAPRWAPLSR